jgi:glutamyl-Q tRNA(Asp) synthetase
MLRQPEIASQGHWIGPVLRFAPSPNGYLHLGHAYSALLNCHLAERHGGRFLLRIEDIDRIRCTQPLIEACLADLTWLGLRWEEPVRRQSDHLSDYAAGLERLRMQGLVYPCFCSRQDIAKAVARHEKAAPIAGNGTSWPHDPDGAWHYPMSCKMLDPDESRKRIMQGELDVWRLDMRKALSRCGAGLSYRCIMDDDRVVHVPIRPERWGDPILARRDIGTSYHLAVTLDDAIQGITHVVRGRDLEAATDIHVVLHNLLGLPVPLYHFHDLVKDEGGDKLSKSRQSTSLRQLRAEGWTPALVRQQLGF